MTKLKLESETCIDATFVSQSELTANLIPDCFQHGNSLF